MLKLTDLHKRFGKINAVAGLSLHVEPGEVFGLLGPNGAGKTTTVHMIAGFTRPDTGTIDLGGRGSPCEMAVREVIGIAPQSLALYDELTAEENLAFFAAIHRLPRAAAAKRVDAVLELVALGDRRRDRVKTYSGGMKRRLNIAAALVHEPELLILDEPTAGVDPQSRTAIVEAARALGDDGVTVIYTTHYLEEAERVCDRAAIVDHGACLAEGTVDELIEAHGGLSTLVVDIEGETLRLETAEPLAALNRIAAEKEILRFRVERPTLEKVFLNLTGRSLRD